MAEQAAIDDREGVATEPIVDDDFDNDTAWMDVDLTVDSAVSTREKSLLDDMRRTLANTPKDVVTVLGKRGGKDLQKLLKQYEEYVTPPESPDIHAPSGSAPPRPDHGSMNDVQAPAPNPRPSNDPEFDWDYWTNLEDEPQPKRPKLESSKEFGQAYDDQVEHAQQPNEGPSIPKFDWDKWANLEFQAQRKRPKPESSKEPGQAYENEVEHAQQPNLGPSTDPEFNWDYWTNLENQPQPKRPKVESSKESGQAHENEAEHAQQPNPGSSTDFDLNDFLTELIGSDDQLPLKQPEPELLSSNPGPSPSGSRLLVEPWSPEEPEHEQVVQGPPPSLASPELTDPELHSDHQPLSQALGKDEFLNAIYAAKGKAKVSRRILGTARHVGNGA
ncbi:hypothetical protein BGY98DRAFT_1100153 [Russula aff. rugulosa BPL654]|nr:hypothetical protein BGY98DRAFT_1100153 [Russula aff. rugulosa BPL654]